MRAGRLDRRITIRIPVESQSDSGEVVTTWSDLATVWAEQLNLPGFERYAFQQTVGRALMTFKVRFSSATKQVTTKCRLIMEGREYDITDVRETRRNEELQIDCFAPSDQPVST